MSSRQRPRASSQAPRTNAPPREPTPTGLAARPDPSRIPLYVGLAVLGAAAGIAGTVLQAALFPGGLLLSLAASAGLFYGGRVLMGTQLGALVPAVGWFIAVVLLLGGRPEGDYVFGEEIGLALFMLGTMAVAVMCATMTRLPHPADDTGRTAT
ncbi:DUF6113 family protein [Streptomyces sp. ALB3]|uniref:DUF6113 family protein n=1 Tax=Streptomyces sp. ALB3 TaxID=3374278 RepID=UPI0037AC75E2